MRAAFSPQLRWASLWPALAALATVAAALALLLSPLLERTAAGGVRQTVRLVAPLVAARAASGADLQEWARALVAGGDLRLSVIAGDGTVLVDSAHSVAQIAAMENHGDRPEVGQALARGEGAATRRSETTGVAYVYAARAVTVPPGRVLVVRVAQPLTTLAPLYQQLIVVVALACAVALGSSASVSWWLRERLWQPLSGVLSGAETLAEGDFTHRLQVPPEREPAILVTALNRLATEVERQIAAVARERDQLRAILANMGEGVLVVARDGRAILANPAFAELFRLPAEIAGRPIIELTRQRRLAQLIEATLDGQPQATQLVLDQPERRTVALVSAPLPASQGVVVTARDVSAFTRLAETRRDFVANVSHELKTPLAAIRGYAETLRDGALAEPQAAARFTDGILQQCRRLQALLEDLLTLSRLESLDGRADRQPVDLEEVARRAIEVMAPTAAARGLTLELDAKPVPPLAGDPDGLERMLLNLLDNAIKYNRPGGSVTLAVRPHAGQALLEVRDTGIGIPAEARARIFERFYRVDKGRSRAEGGTGLGLAIVKHVAQAHGGRVEVESEMGAGTTFRVLFEPEASASG